MEEKAKGAILQRDKETYAIVPRTPVGLVTPEIFEKITAVVKKYNIPIMKITSGQRLALVGIKEDDVNKVWNDLAMDIGRAKELCVHYVQACPGTAVCKFGVRDSLGMGIELEQTFENYEQPAKVKFGVSGCPLCCAESYVRDVGLIGKRKGWIVTFGGNAGGRPRIGDVIAENLSKEEAIQLVRDILQYYKENGKKKERTARFVERVGIESVRQAVLKT
ncbi:MAG: NAD(P)/FAD-dependent oxidoreductase [Desulfobulbaceae bacterium]|nr:NAD(P)/FAD-dependent oxidoreductase [Desulfobulbaceae bacterium]MCK5340124.1 NAD(P)/FAD-dependent oxidoreductase [Desulfobulbaceae bacterium]MCK5404048.1 NAD(P)/FAD-dependent oxidoreductase [Desulfobulbaceae bacterium]